MELIPAIDLLDGKVVRLHQGKYDQVTVYSDDPVSEAKKFYEQGAQRIHVVDLEGARSGGAAHAKVVEQIVKSVPIAVQIGGGVRDRDAAERWLNLGADRVVLGTVAVRDPELTQYLCSKHPGRVVVAIDARDGLIAIDGWREGTTVKVEDLARQVDSWGAIALLFTDIARDGTRAGPAVQSTAELQRSVGATVIASGGIGALEDLLALKKMGVRAAVCGRALYSGAFTLAEALSALKDAQ